MDSFIRKVFYNAINQAIITIFPIITLPIVLHAIPPDIYGKYIFYQSLIQYCIVFVGFGYDFYAVREVASLTGQLLSDKINQLFYLRLFTGIIIFISILTIGSFIIDDFWMFFLLTLLIFSSLFNINWLVMGLGEFKTIATRQLMGKVIFFILIILFIHKPKDIYAFVVIQFIADFVPNIAILYQKRRLVKFKIQPIKRIHILIQAISKEFSAIKFLFASQIFIVVGVNLDKTILAFYARQNNDLGIYAVAYNIFLIIYSFLISTGPVLLFSSAKKASSNNQKINYLIVALLLSLLGSLILYLNQNAFVHFVGQKYVASYPILILLLIKLPFAIFSNWVINSFLLPNRLDKLYFYFFLVFIIGNSICTYFFIKYFGIYGAVCASIISELFLFFELLFYYIKTSKSKHVKAIS